MIGRLSRFVPAFCIGTDTDWGLLWGEVLMVESGNMVIIPD